MGQYLTTEKRVTIIHRIRLHRKTNADKKVGHCKQSADFDALDSKVGSTSFWDCLCTTDFGVGLIPKVSMLTSLDW